MVRNLALLLVLILFGSSLLIVSYVDGTGVPAIPEFNVIFNDHSYDVPPSYTVDPYTGKSVTAEEGYHVQNKTMVVIIKNQPFTSYIDADNHSISLYYSIRIKGHFDGSWFYLDSGYYGQDVHYIPADLSSEYTILAYGLVGNNGTLGLLNVDVPSGGQVDFQIQAFIGYNSRISDGWTMLGEIYHYVFTGETSDWSDTKTLTIEDNKTILDEPITIWIFLVIAVMLVVAFVFLLRKRVNPP